MHSRQRLFLTLFLAQGACLAFGFWIRSEMVTSFRNAASSSGEFSRGSWRTDSRWDTTIAANCLAFVGTWGLLTGICGLVFLREHNARPARRPPQTEVAIVPSLAIYHEQDEQDEIVTRDLASDMSDPDDHQSAIAAAGREPPCRGARESVVPLAN